MSYFATVRELADGRYLLRVCREEERGKQQPQYAAVCNLVRRGGLECRAVEVTGFLAREGVELREAIEAMEQAGLELGYEEYWYLRAGDDQWHIRRPKRKVNV